MHGYFIEDHFRNVPKVIAGISDSSSSVEEEEIGEEKIGNDVGNGRASARFLLDCWVQSSWLSPLLHVASLGKASEIYKHCLVLYSNQ